MQPSLPDTSDPAALLGARVCDERYKILAPLGTGNMGHVYRAYDTRLENDVVIKVPTSSRLHDPEFRARFDREMLMLVRLNHPHVVNVTDFGNHHGIPMIVMQYLAGGSLRDRMQAPDKSRYAMQPRTLRDWLQSVARALDFLNTQGTVHRDVKPGNILFDDHGNAFLADFGLTKFHSDPDYEESENASFETAAGFVIGTPTYVAPEIVLGREYDGRADQYSLGLTVYEALSAEVPMRAKTASATMVNQTQLVAPLLHTVNSTIPVALSRVIEKAIKKSPDNRFGSCDEFAEAAIEALSASATSATVAGMPQQAAAAPTTRNGALTDKNRKKSSKAGRSGSSVRPRKPTPAEEFDEFDEFGSYDEFADELQSLPKQLPKRTPTGNAKSGKVGKTSKGKPGEVPCPKCRESLKINVEFAGRKGRCVHCQTRMKIGPQAASLKIIADRSSGVHKTQDDDVQIGEKVFGYEFSHKAILGLALVMMATLIGLTIYITTVAVQPDDESELPEKSAFEATD